MKLWGWTCVECDTHYQHVDGLQTERGVSIRCPDCGEIERIPDRRPSPEVTP